MQKILFIHHSLEGGGAERILIDLLRSFDFTKYSIDLLLIKGKGVYINEIPRQVNYLGAIYKNRRGIFKKALTILRLQSLFEPFEIRNRVKSKYDVIVSFMECYPIYYHKYIMNRAKKNVTWVHTDLKAMHWSKKLYLTNNMEASVYSSMDKVVFVSLSALKGFVDLFNYKHNNLVVIHNPIDQVRIRQLASEEDITTKTAFTFVAIGRLHPLKRYDRLLEAAKELKDKGAVFKIIVLGGGDLLLSLKEYAAELELNNEVKFMGFVQNPYKYLRSADAFVLSSDIEGYPTVVCEAMTLGVPVIGTDVSGTRDLLLDSEYGLLTEKDSHALANAMYVLYSDSNKREYFKRKAIERGNSFSLDETMKSIYAIL